MGKPTGGANFHRKQQLILQNNLALSPYRTKDRSSRNVDLTRISGTGPGLSALSSLETTHERDINRKNREQISYIQRQYGY